MVAALLTTAFIPRTPHMYFHLALAPLVSLVAGILILVMPRLLNYIVAIYLIVIGIIGLLAQHGTVV
jgi:hypothetical protein